MRSSVNTKRRIPWYACAFLVAAACETAPPVQEMSDARQAIEVARQAGAEAHAKPELNEALDFLEAAEHDLDVEEYARARKSALQAKNKALEARALSEAVQPQ